MLELRFVRPTPPDRWTGGSLAFARGLLMLVATGLLATADNMAGYDDGAVGLLYKVELIGREDLSIIGVRALIKRAAGVTPLEVKAQEPLGATMMTPHIWRSRSPQPVAHLVWRESAG